MKATNLKAITDGDVLVLQGIEETMIFHGWGKGKNTLEARCVMKVEAPDGSIWVHDSVRYFKMRKEAVR